MWEHFYTFFDGIGFINNKEKLGRAIRKPVKANSGLNVKRSINFCRIKMFFTAYVLCSFRLFKLKTEGQAI